MPPELPEPPLPESTPDEPESGAAPPPLESAEEEPVVSVVELVVVPVVVEGTEIALPVLPPGTVSVGAGKVEEAESLPPQATAPMATSTPALVAARGARSRL